MTAQFASPASILIEPAPFAERLTELLSTTAAQLRRKAYNWWEGYVDQPQTAVRKTLEKQSIGAQPEKSSDPRIKIAEMVWGDGFAFPGGVEHVLEMVKPMALNEKKSMLYLGAGLGGGPRAIAKTFGTWTTGLEASQDLAAAGMRYSESAGLTKKAPIRHFEPANVKLPANKFNAVCIRQGLHRVEFRNHLLEQVARSMRPEGHLIISDFAVGNRLSPTVDAEEPFTTLSLNQLETAVAELGFDVRIATDVTSEFKALVVKGWANLAQALVGKSLDPAEALSLAHEIKVWSGHLAAFTGGELSVIRLHAIKKLM